LQLQVRQHVILARTLRFQAIADKASAQCAIRGIGPSVAEKNRPNSISLDAGLELMPVHAFIDDRLPLDKGLRNWA
jgi:hypothetical protein